MKSDTQTVLIERDPQAVFAFLAEPQNLPRWALRFCKQIRKADGDWWLVTPPQDGAPELRVRYASDPDDGVIDFVLSPQAGVEMLLPTRVVANGAGAEYIFTQFQFPGMPDEVFEQQVASLAEEFAALKRALES